MLLSVHKKRRQLLKLGVQATGATALQAMFPFAARGMLCEDRQNPAEFQDIDLKALTELAMDAAVAAGAEYADIRFTYDRERHVGWTDGSLEYELSAVGVRALANGFWGFAAGSAWTSEEVVRLSQRAVELAKANSLGKPGATLFTPPPVFNDRHWKMEVEVDPFTVNIAELEDTLRATESVLGIFLDAAGIPVHEKPRVHVGAEFLRQERTYGNSTGSYGTQILYNSRGVFEDSGPGFNVPQLRLNSLSPAGIGWEILSKPSINTEIERAVERWLEDRQLPKMPVDVGRFNVIFDAESMARIASGTLGLATELDRALGFEANATGTSYLNDPYAMAGSLRIGSPLLTLKTNRSEPGGAATVGWDDEGVAPTATTLIKDGILKNFQTTGQQAMQKQDDHPANAAMGASTGCAMALNGMYEPIPRTGNLSLQPGAENLTYNDLVTQMDDGIVFENGLVQMDHQQNSGLLMGRTYEIRKGRKVAMLNGAGVLFQASELWKQLTRLGGQASVDRFGVRHMKGEPQQPSAHTVETPPANFKDIIVIDLLRRA